MGKHGHIYLKGGECGSRKRSSASGNIHSANFTLIAFSEDKSGSCFPRLQKLCYRQTCRISGSLFNTDITSYFSEFIF